MDELINKGIQKVEDDAKVDLQHRLEEVIKAEVKEEDWKRREILEGLRISCLALFREGTNNCLYGLLDDDTDIFEEEYEELI